MNGTAAEYGAEQVSAASRGWRTALAVLAVGLLVVLFAHQATVSVTLATWSRSKTYQFCWVVLPTLAYLIWHFRSRFGMYVPAGSMTGAAAALVFSVLWIAGDLMNVAEARQFSLVAIFCAVVLAVVGRLAFCALLPFLTLTAFLVPTGEFLQIPLKHMVAAVARGVAAVAGLPYSGEGFTIFIGAQRYVVVDDCTGLPYLLTGLFLGLTLGLLIYRTWWKIAAMFLLGGGLAILTNLLRVIGIVLYDYAAGTEMSLSEHTYFQWFAMALNFGVLFLVFYRLNAEPERNVTNQALPGPKTWVRILAPAAVAVLVVAAAPLMLADSRAESAGNTGGVALPLTVAGWTRDTSQADTGGWQPRRLTDSRAIAPIRYRKGAQVIDILVVEASSRRTRVSGGAIDLAGAQDWMPGQRAVGTYCASDGNCIKAAHTRLLLRDSKSVRHIYTLYAAGDVTTASAAAFRFRRALAEVRSSASLPRLIAIASDGASGPDNEDIAALLLGVVAAR